MNAISIPITIVKSSKIFDDGPLTLAQINATNLDVSTLLKADHIAEKTVSHGTTIDQVLNLPAGIPADAIYTALCDTTIDTYRPSVIGDGTNVTLWTTGYTDSNLIAPLAQVKGLITLPPGIPAGSVLRVTAQVKKDGSAGYVQWYIIPVEVMPAIGDTINTTTPIAAIFYEYSNSTTYVTSTGTLVVGAYRKYVLALAIQSFGGTGYIQDVVISCNVTPPSFANCRKFVGSS